MIKYNITRYEEFSTCIVRTRPVYLEKVIKYDPIPEMYGLILPFIKDNKIVIGVFTVEDNKHIPYREFEKMLININMPGNSNVKLFNLDDLLNIYEDYDNKHYRLFILDDLIERNITIEK